MWDVVVDEQKQERRQQQQQQQQGGVSGLGPQQQQGGPSGTAPQLEAEESEVVVGSGLRCRRAGGVMTWVQSQQARGAEAHGASVPDELAQNLDFVLVLGGAGDAGGVMTWVQSQQAGGADTHGASVPDELAQNLDFVLVLGGGGSWCYTAIAVRPSDDLHPLPWPFTPSGPLETPALLPWSTTFTPSLPHLLHLPGDGTLMWTCHLFGNRAVPPLLPFNLGSLGFLTPFAPEELAPCLHHVVQGEGRGELDRPGMHGQGEEP